MPFRKKIQIKVLSEITVSGVFVIILLFSHSCRSPEKKIVALQPLGGLDKALLDSVSTSITKIYGFSMIILNDRPMPPETYVNIKSPRFRADSLLRYLLRIKPDSADFIMGLTGFDISTTKKDASGKVKQPASKYSDWGVFGLGFRPGCSCVISTYRIRNADYSLFAERLQKVCVHELGHNLGLDHCPSEWCVLKDAAETITTIDAVNLSLCDNCIEKVF